MKWKLDENFGSRTIHIFLEAGHDAETVLQEKISGASDDTLYQVCLREERCLVTLDIDFADVLRFPPHRTAGIAVLRLPKNPSLRLLETMVENLLQFYASQAIHGHLWIVEAGRVRVRDDTDPALG